MRAHETDGDGGGKGGRTPIGAAPAPVRPPQIRRTRSWLVKVTGLALLPVEEKLAPILEEHQAQLEAGNSAGVVAAELRLMREHPFVSVQHHEVKATALAAGVTCEMWNCKMNVALFQKWLRSPEGKPFEELGKGYDDGCYLTSAVLRAHLPRGYTAFTFRNDGGETVSAVLRGFRKFTGLTATDEDEESNATAYLDAFMFHGYRRADASRFAVTTKSNGENGKYTVRKIFGEWYCFAGSKNTGVVWRWGSDVAELYPLPLERFAQVGPKIVHHVNSIMSKMTDDARGSFMDTISSEQLTVMVELNDPTNEHIFPIAELRADHVALLSSRGYPQPQSEARALFDRFGLRRVSCEVHERMSDLDSSMDDIRASTEVEGAVIYLERDDDTAVGLVKVKSDYYVIARRIREAMRGALVRAVAAGKSVDEALRGLRRRLRIGMRELTHVSGCKEHHEEWAALGIAFAESWAEAYRSGTAAKRKALAAEFEGKYGSLYQRFWRAWQRGERDIAPVCLLISTEEEDGREEGGPAQASPKGKGGTIGKARGKGGKRGKR